MESVPSSSSGSKGGLSNIKFAVSIRVKPCAEPGSLAPTREWDSNCVSVNPDGQGNKKYGPYTSLVGPSESQSDTYSHVM